MLFCMLASMFSLHPLQPLPCGRSPVVLPRPHRLLLQAQQNDRTEQSAAKERPPPWNFSFQCNERYLKWDASAQRQLLKMHVADKLDKDIGWVEGKLLELADVLPDLSTRLDNMKVDLVVQLISDIQAVAQKLVDLRGVMPGVNVSCLLAKHPVLLLQLNPGKVARQMQELRDSFPEMDVTDLIEREPLMLTVTVKSVFSEVKRLMPSKDPAQYVFCNPTVVLSMDEHMMGSTIDGDLT